MGNENLHAAKRAKNDEFYTRYADIEAECRHYAPYFKGKTIFCPCDDAVWSQFAAYFARNFQVLGLKKLICSCFYEPQGDLFTPIDPKRRGYWTCYEGQMPADKWLNNPQRNYFKGFHGGDFRSPEVTALLKQSDFVVTNPPFSLWRDFFDWVKEKRFLIIGTMQSVTYKNVFPYFKNEKLFLGSGGVRANIEFELPKNEKEYGENVKWRDGTPFIKLPNACWFQNIFRHAPCKPPLVLTKSYYADPSKYPKYDNYDAINVDSVRDIPYDYFGEMGVPINFIDNYFASGFVVKDGFSRYSYLTGVTPETRGKFLAKVNGEYKMHRLIVQKAPSDSQKKSALTVEFEVLANTSGKAGKAAGVRGVGAKFVDDYCKNGGRGCYSAGHTILCYYENGKPKIPVGRVLIRRRAVPLFAKNG